MRFAVAVFPGSNCEEETFRLLSSLLEQPVEYLWHRERDLSRFDCVILPGGFSYGDYLRCGAMASLSPLVQALPEFVLAGGKLLGICNGFQILLEAGLLPGALLPNRSLKYISRKVCLRVGQVDTPFTNRLRPGQVIRLPIAHYEGSYFADEATLERLETGGRILLQYSDPAGRVTEGANPNGSARSIAAICSADRNVVGMMPHPERASEDLLGSEDGLRIFESLIGGAARKNHCAGDRRA